jgi:CMP/dCMP kinase
MQHAERQNFVIAIDGPAASGKGTIGRRLARELGFAYLDTGLLYRAATKLVVQQGVSPFDIKQVINAVRHICLRDMCSGDLRTPEISDMTPKIAEIPEVREILGQVQRKFALNPPIEKRGVVFDGRDIGTIICPNADVKLFITASLGARADRRFKELIASGRKTSLEEVHNSLHRRDQQDFTRTISPLRAARDAVILDSTDMSVDEAFIAALAIVNQKLYEGCKR